jgi:hypothetical protein
MRKIFQMPTRKQAIVIIVLLCWGLLIYVVVCMPLTGVPAPILPRLILTFIALTWMIGIASTRSRPKDSPVEINNRQLRRRRPRSEEGIWRDAPIAEVDKSTIGKLLASRMRREPGLHVVVRGPDSAPEPFRQDALYDAELDG